MKHWMLAIWVVTWTADVSHVRPCMTSEQPPAPKGSKHRIRQACYDKSSKKMTRRFGSVGEAVKFSKECPKTTCRDWKITKGTP